MATKTYKGALMRITVGGKSILHSTSANLSITTEFSEISTKDGYDVFPEDIKWGMACEQVLAEDGDALQIGSSELLDHQLAGDLVQLEFSHHQTGDFKLSGAAYVETADLSAAKGERGTGSWAFKGTGDIVKTTVA